MEDSNFKPPEPKIPRCKAPNAASCGNAWVCLSAVECSCCVVDLCCRCRQFLARMKTHMFKKIRKQIARALSLRRYPWCPNGIHGAQIPRLDATLLDGWQWIAFTAIACWKIKITFVPQHSWVNLGLDSGLLFLLNI